MKQPLPASIVTVFFGLLIFSAFPVLAQQSCESLKTIQIPHVTITAVTAGKPGYELPAQQGFMNSPATRVPVSFCRVEAYSAPTGDSHIGMEVWLPAAANWNGNFLAAGNPGFIGSISSSALARIMEQGYVAAQTDTGHLDPGFKWAIGHPEKWADWGYRAVHEMAVVTKQLADRYYGKAIEHSYWNSCHNGGNQGLNEAQRYPDDFDGIVVGDPAFYISHLQPGSLYISWLALKDGVNGPGYIPTPKLAVIHQAVLKQCDANDGLADGLIENPLKCNFDPASIQCQAGDEPTCLTAAQVDTVRKIYAGAKFKDGTPIYSGFERGSEMNWPFMIEKDPFSVNLNYFKGLVFEDPNWDFRTFDVDRDTRLGIRKTGSVVDAINPDLHPFKQAGGKMIIIMSWNSLALPPRQILEYYKNVVAAMGGLKQTRDFARFFAIPGGGGCPGFVRNTGDYKALDAMQQWVEKGVAPERIIYKYRRPGNGGPMSGGAVYRTRPTCPWPWESRYNGSGDINKAENFTCVNPDK